MVQEAVQESDEIKKKGGLVKILILGINILLFVGGIGFFAMTKFGMLTPDTANETQRMVQDKTQDSMEASSDPASSPDHAMHTYATEEPLLFEMQPILVNLRGDRGRRYLNVSMHVEMTGEEEKEKIQKYLPLIRNRLILLMSEKTFEAVSSVDGKYILQEEVSQIYNEILGTDMVRRTLFTNFILQ